MFNCRSDAVVFATDALTTIFGEVDVKVLAPEASSFKLWTKIMVGAKLLNCFVKDTVNPAPIPPTAINRALPIITIKIVRIDLTFLSHIDSIDKIRISLIFNLPFILL